eukprot:CAMPEP_0173390364 /NCGR_PEP_ID=MMETSP1356-20130122/14601_1 /TAXON_ID=77927 ORGANISM="Hemiselmis virescens, Strain PCC157" /NCGR_SAMPLE_ID=MMETSP1356 /ASSEMBLY_ACC=CAM_ASM_000847 /LENGTH=31 /DNA_ID= /DNA_START= /DNA_END= /DNA_ORIENTATION=
MALVCAPFSRALASPKARSALTQKHSFPNKK